MVEVPLVSLIGQVLSGMTVLALGYVGKVARESHQLIKENRELAIENQERLEELEAMV